LPFGGGIGAVRGHQKFCGTLRPCLGLCSLTQIHNESPSVMRAFLLQDASMSDAAQRLKVVCGGVNQKPFPTLANFPTLTRPFRNPEPALTLSTPNTGGVGAAGWAGVLPESPRLEGAGMQEAHLRDPRCPSSHCSPPFQQSSWVKGAGVVSENGTSARPRARLS